MAGRYVKECNDTTGLGSSKSRGADRALDRAKRSTGQACQEPMRRCEAQVICYIAWVVMSISLCMTYHLILGSVGRLEESYLSVSLLYSIFPVWLGF
jgi:hypothetical protein